MGRICVGDNVSRTFQPIDWRPSFQTELLEGVAFRPTVNLSRSMTTPRKACFVWGSKAFSCYSRIRTILTDIHLYTQILYLAPTTSIVFRMRHRAASNRSRMHELRCGSGNCRRWSHVLRSRLMYTAPSYWNGYTTKYSWSPKRGSWKIMTPQSGGVAGLTLAALRLDSVWWRLHASLAGMAPSMRPTRIKRSMSSWAS